MVIDSSVLFASLSNEVDAPDLIKAMTADSVRLLSVASLLETAIVIESRHGLAGGKKLDEFIRIAQIVVQPVTIEQLSIARAAFRSYGKGRHPAALNFGDCFAYALAKFRSEPLLFKGNDFSQTDVQLV